MPGNVLVNQVIDVGSVMGGLVMMNNNNLDCSSKAKVSVGHLSSIRSYSYGDMSIQFKTAHKTSGGRPPINAFTCFSLFTGTSGGSTQHNEIALCWNPSDLRNLHFSYWNGKADDGDKMHQKKIPLTFDPSQGFHTYTVKWRKNGIQVIIDGTAVATLEGRRIPWEPMALKIILRPLGSATSPTVYLGNARLSIMSTSYVNAPSDTSFASSPIPAPLGPLTSGPGVPEATDDAPPTTAPTRLRRRRPPTPRPQRRRRPTPRPQRRNRPLPPSNAGDDQPGDDQG